MQSVEEQPTSELVLLFVDLCVEITEIKEHFITHKTRLEGRCFRWSIVTVEALCSVDRLSKPFSLSQKSLSILAL